MKATTTLSKTIVGLAAVVFLMASGGLASGKEPSGKSLHDQLVGYWAPDKEKMLKMIKEQMAKAGQTDPQALATELARFETMANTMLVGITRDAATIHLGPVGPMKSTYKVKSTDEDTGTITVAVTNQDGKKTKGKSIIKGDKLTMIDDQHTMHLHRITEAEFKRRLEASKKLKEAGKDALDAAKKATDAAKPKDSKVSHHGVAASAAQTFSSLAGGSQQCLATIQVHGTGGA